MTNLLLNNDELIELTGFKLPSRQVVELRRLGIEHRVRADGKPVVSRRAFEKAMGGIMPSNDAPDWEPDFSSLEG